MKLRPSSPRTHVSSFAVPKRQSAIHRRTIKSFPSPRCVSATQIVRPSRSRAEIQPKLHPALLRSSEMISECPFRRAGLASPGIAGQTVGLGGTTCYEGGSIFWREQRPLIPARVWGRSFFDQEILKEQTAPGDGTEARDFKLGTQLAGATARPWTARGPLGILFR